MAATVSLAKPAARAATARSRRAARTSSLSERVSGKGMVIAAPRRKGPGSIPQDTAAPKTIQGHLLLYFVAEVITAFDLGSGSLNSPGSVTPQSPTQQQGGAIPSV